MGFDPRSHYGARHRNHLEPGRRHLLQQRQVSRTIPFLLRVAHQLPQHLLEGEVGFAHTELLGAVPPQRP